ncbi:MAG: hypothetical protein K2X24_18430 [Methylobacterium sp.]|nr:hypothetical protein [Methylobacterium sp.]
MMQHDGFLPASGPRALRPSDFSPEQQAGWIAASERKAALDAALDPDAAHANEADVTEWYVAYTNPKREEAVAVGLRRRQVASFWPAMRVSRTRSRRRVTELAPLLPRYLFVGLAPGQSLYSLRETPGLEGMVRADGRPAKVKPELITGLRDAQASGTYDFSDEAMAAKDPEGAPAREKGFEPGAKVRVMLGAYRSFSGAVHEVLPPDRISVWITIFGRAFPVPMMLADVELE